MKQLTSAFRTPFLVTLILFGIAAQFLSAEIAFAVEDSNTTANEAEPALLDETATDESSTQEDGAVLELASEEPEATENTQNNTDTIQPETTPANSELSLSDSKARDAVAETTKDDKNSYTNIYRVYNPHSGEHFFTYNFNEAKHLSSIGWQWENIAWVAPMNSEPVYRLYNPNSGDHHFTTNKSEYDSLQTIGWRGEGIGWHSDSAKKVPLYRLFNPNEVIGTHHYTANKEERDQLIRIGWRDEGVGWYATDDDPIEIDPQWLVTSSWGSLERYWINANGTIAKNRLILPEEGTGYLAYAKTNGAVVRGKWNNGAGYVYVADNDGRLASTPDGKTGWLVTSKYDSDLRRYYYDADKHAMRTGLFTIGDKQYYGMTGNGYVAHNNVVTANGKTYFADNDGALTETHSEHDITLARALAELAVCTNDAMTKEQKLRAAYNHIRDDFAEHNPRIPHMKQLGWETIYANDMFVDRGGNCCSYGAAFAFMAKAIGYSNVYCCNSGGHGWAEVEGRVYDPEWERANRGRSYFSVGYYDNTDVNYKIVLNNADWMRVAI